MKRILLLAALALASSNLPPWLDGVALAQEKQKQDTDAPPSPEAGLAFAQRFCKDCHLVEGSGATTVPAGIPTLRGIANRPEQTADRVRNVLINPHPPMPDMHVSSREILDLLAYLDTLRAPTSGPPLLTPEQRGAKPKYPKPS